MDQVKIGKFIAECRKRQKLTQQALAEKLGVSDRTVGNWENGRNMPDLSLFKTLCQTLNISLNDLMSGEQVKEQEYQARLEENIINTIDYTNKKLESKNQLLGWLLLAFGFLIIITAMTIFPSDSSWGSIYAIWGVIISLIGISRFTKALSFISRLICHFSYVLVAVLLLIAIDYIGVINIKEAPRFALYKIYGDGIVYYDTLFYDVVRCNVNQSNETYQIIPNQTYDNDHVDIFCNQS